MRKMPDPKEWTELDLRDYGTLTRAGFGRGHTLHLRKVYGEQARRYAKPWLAAWLAYLLVCLENRGPVMERTLQAHLRQGLPHADALAACYALGGRRKMLWLADELVGEPA